MISNEERREVAERLMERERGWRKMGTHLNVMPDMPATQFEDVAALLGFSGLVLDADVFARLVELIDRPTCRNIYAETEKVGGCENGFKCSECGECVSIAKEIPCSGACAPYLPSYCPNCGREVVE